MDHTEERQLAALFKIAELAGSEPRPNSNGLTEATAFVWASVRRWVPMHRAFAQLFTMGLVDEARLITRAAAELAVNAAWTVAGQATKVGRYSTPEERAKGLEENARAETLKWWNAMNEQAMDRPFPQKMIDTWSNALAGAKPPAGLPDLRGRAAAVQSNNFALMVYDFTYRSDSQVTHGNTWSIIAGVKGELQFPPMLALANALSVALLLMSAGSEALNSDRMTEAAQIAHEGMGIPRVLG